MVCGGCVLHFDLSSAGPWWGQGGGVGWRVVGGGVPERLRVKCKSTLSDRVPGTLLA